MVITPEQLRDAREFASLTQSELAHRLGVAQRTIVNWESASGQGVPRKSERKVLQLLGEAMRLVATMPPADWDPGEPPERMDDALPESPIGDEVSAQQRRRRAAMEPFSDLDLITELGDRARERGVKLTDWSTRAVDARNVPATSDDDYEVTPEGPKSGYALAAKRGRKKADQPHAE